MNSSEMVETECGNSASEDHQTPHLLSTTSKCNSCCESFENEDMFNCLTCMDCVDDTQKVSIHCEGCIISHVRKGHEVLDHKSLKPAICADHKNLCSMFCTNCEDILCTNCLSKHLGHGMVPLKEKAEEVRKKVFELISELDTSEKVISKTKDRLTKDKEKYTSGYDDLIEKVSTQFDQMKQDVLDKIKMEHDKMINAGKESEDNLDLLLKCESDLRELLSKSIGFLITECLGLEKTTNAIKETQVKLNNLHVEEKLHDIASNTLEPLAREFTVKCWENVQMPMLKSSADCKAVAVKPKTPVIVKHELGLCERLESQCAWLRISHNSFLSCFNKEKLLNIFADGREVRVYEMRLKEADGFYRAQKSYDKVGKFIADKIIERLLVFPQVFFKNQCILILADRHVLKFDPSSNMFSYTKFEPPINHITLLICSVDQVVDYVYWDSVSKDVRQTNKGSVKIHCPSEPIVKMNSTSDEYMFFITDQKNIIRFDTYKEYSPSVLLVKEGEHKVKNIDCVSRLSGNQFVIWSLATQSLTIMENKLVKCVVPFGSQLNFFSVPSVGNKTQFLVAAIIGDGYLSIDQLKKQGIYREKNFLMISNV